MHGCGAVWCGSLLERARVSDVNWHRADCMEREFGDLCAKLAHLRGALGAAQIAAAHDERLTAELRELVAAVDAIAFSAERARNASREPIDVDAIRRALPPCQRQFNLLKQRFAR